MLDRKTSKEIQAEINALTEQLAATLRLEIADLSKQVEEGDVEKDDRTPYCYYSQE